MTPSDLVETLAPVARALDSLGVLRTNAGTIHRPYLERHARALGVSDLLTKARDEA